jgi:hypothetical protein
MQAANACPARSATPGPNHDSPLPPPTYSSSSKQRRPCADWTCSCRQSAVGQWQAAASGARVGDVGLWGLGDGIEIGEKEGGEDGAVVTPELYFLRRDSASSLHTLLQSELKRIELSYTELD